MRTNSNTRRIDWITHGNAATNTAIPSTRANNPLIILSLQRASEGRQPPVFDSISIGKTGG